MRQGLVLLAHLRAGSVTVRVGDLVVPGDRIGDCGNSGNSTEPHLHLQVSDTLERDARGIPMAFQRSGQQPRMPHDGDIVTV